MAAQTGRTNKKFISVLLDNSAGALTDLTSYATDVGGIGPEYETQDVTAFGDGVKNITVGHPAHPVTLTFVWDTVVLTHLAALNPVTPLSMDIRYGVRQTWTSGEPQYGLTMSTGSGFVLTGIKVNNVESIVATFDVYGPTAPTFGTTAET